MFLEQIPKAMRDRIELPSSLTTNGACWQWTGGTNKPSPHGYGQARYEGKTWRVHRLAWHLTHGGIPEGLMVLHRCDNRPCCNPDHLFLGTCQDNMDDKVSKGRQMVGVRQPQSKLTAEDVRWIRMQLRTGATRNDLAELYGVSRTTIFNVLSGHRWTHVT